MRIFAKFHKGEELCFLSHLDMQRLMQRAMRRAHLPLLYSQGFHPHPLLSFASALPVGYTSDAEWMDMRLEDSEFDEAAFINSMNGALPPGVRVLQARQAEMTQPALTAMMQSASYDITLHTEEKISLESLRQAGDAFLSQPIVVEKRTKGGLKQVDIRPMLISMQVSEAGNGENDFSCRIEGVLNAAGSLNIELLMRAYMQFCGIKGNWTVHRAAIEFEKLGG